ncbi:ornithine--oxo-acid transaminase [Subtercola boreus]|uniref:ornithine aminotransferase n=1 Tax=Subtercola boreus TaxID=120213 RepID=A0A3E0WG48_9MICO|nr:ornithine--oxo-acid transaminase [Subtercola boreus]RFA23498.1 ornithine--oxo-acid transaminase [Subtercola boreus]RFA23891.1 ornithine--oxo-acid transaminase [Subtercola boreus]RFA29591.1 ornithine--oxo-acid transaminase [Subtercola boreus]
MTPLDTVSATDAGLAGTRLADSGLADAGLTHEHHADSHLTDAAIAREEAHAAHNYLPLPIVVESGDGAWVTAVDGRRYLDCLAAYSAVNFGHSNPVLLDAAREQLGRITLTSRAFHNDRLGPFVEALAALAGKDMVLPMNTGAEAVESGIKVARAWGYRVKGVADGMANIVVADGNFHGRTISIVSFSDDASARDGFGPFTPGFRSVPYGDAAALEAAIDENTVAVLLEPIQGEAGIIVPPASYLPAVRDICTAHSVLMIADEIQSGLGRTGTTFACDRVGVVPDLYLLGKALGGGIVPVSAVVGNADILGVLRPGEHGSTFGGNPLAAAVGSAVVAMLATGEYQRLADDRGALLAARLQALLGHGVVAVRTAGLWAGIDIDPALASGRAVCERLMQRGVLAKDTHGSTIRLAPPLVVSAEDLDWAVDQLAAVLEELGAK